MAVEGAVVLLVSIERNGNRTIVWAGESTDALPGLMLSPAARLEAHVHLLAASNPARRKAALDDLVNGTQSYSSVLTVSAAATPSTAAPAT